MSSLPPTQSEALNNLNDALQSLPRLYKRLELIKELVTDVKSPISIGGKSKDLYRDIGLVFQGQIMVFKDQESLTSFLNTFYPTLQLMDDYEFIDSFNDVPLGLSHDYPEQTRLNHDNFPLFEFDMHCVPQMELFTLWFPNAMYPGYKSTNVLDNSFTLTERRYDAFGWMPGILHGHDNPSVLNGAAYYSPTGLPLSGGLEVEEMDNISHGSMSRGFSFTTQKPSYFRPPTEPMTIYLNYQLSKIQDTSYMERPVRVDIYQNSFFYHGLPDFSCYMKLPIGSSNPDLPDSSLDFINNDWKLLKTTRDTKKPCRIRGMPQYINYRFNSTGKQLDIGCPADSQRRLVIKIKKTRPINVGDSG